MNKRQASTSDGLGGLGGLGGTLGHEKEFDSATVGAGTSGLGFACQCLPVLASELTCTYLDSFV